MRWIKEEEEVWFAHSRDLHQSHAHYTIVLVILDNPRSKLPSHSWIFVTVKLPSWYNLTSADCGSRCQLVLKKIRLNFHRFWKHILLHNKNTDERSMYLNYWALSFDVSSIFFLNEDSNNVVVSAKDANQLLFSNLEIAFWGQCLRHIRVTQGCFTAKICF